MSVDLEVLRISFSPCGFVDFISHDWIHVIRCVLSFSGGAVIRLLLFSYSHSCWRPACSAADICL